MRTKQRHLKKEFTWILIGLELISILLLLFVLSIDFSAAKVTNLFQFEYFLIVIILGLIVYGCHKILAKYGNIQVLNKFKDEEGDTMQEILWVNAKNSEKLAVKSIKKQHQEDLELLNQKKITKQQFQERARVLMTKLDKLKADYDVLYEEEGIDVRD